MRDMKLGRDEFGPRFRRHCSDLFTGGNDALEHREKTLEEMMPWGIRENWGYNMMPWGIGVYLYLWWKVWIYVAAEG